MIQTNSKVVFILHRRSKTPVGGFLVVYDYANALADLGYPVLVAHGIVFHSKATGVITSNKHPEVIKPKQILAWLAGIVLRRGYPISVPWADRAPNVKYRSFPVLSSSNLPVASRYIATSWRTAKFLSGHGGDKKENFYLIQHFEVWEESSEVKSLVEATWKSGLNKIVISDWLLNIAHELGVSAKVVPNFVDRAAFPAGGGITNRPIAMLFHASTQNFKRMDKAIEVATSIRQIHPNLCIQAFGTQARPKTLPDWITYTKNPSKEALSALYKNSKIYLVTADSEGWCLPALEAMSSGAVVLSTRNGGVESFAEDVAVFPKDNSVEQLVQSLHGLLSAHDDGHLQQRSNRGISLAEDFVISKSVDSLLKALNLNPGQTEEL